jgi:hypothetical protein
MAPHVLWDCGYPSDFAIDSFAMRPEPSVHDNQVYSCQVDCEHKTIILHTVFRDKEAPEFTDVVFNNVLAHRFEHVRPGNILFDVEEIDPALIIRDQAAVFEKSRQYGWPPVEYNGDLDVLIATMKERRISGYSIDSSFGLPGWVLAGSCERVQRDQAARRRDQPSN